MSKFYIVELGQDCWSFLGAVPSSLRGTDGKPEQYHSQGDAELSAAANGYQQVEVAAVSEYSF